MLTKFYPLRLAIRINYFKSSIKGIPVKMLKYHNYKRKKPPCTHTLNWKINMARSRILSKIHRTILSQSEHLLEESVYTIKNKIRTKKECSKLIQFIFLILNFLIRDRDLSSWIETSLFLSKETGINQLSCVMYAKREHLYLYIQSSHSSILDY